MNTQIARIIVFALLTCCSRAWAGIVWEKTEIEVTPKEGETKVTVPFFFEIEKGSAVQILDVGSSCGCTVPTLEKRLYASGESGVLDVVFTPGMRQGKQVKQVVLKTVESGVETNTKLTLIVNLPERAKPEKTKLEWTGEDRGIKSVKIDVKPGITLAIGAIPLLPEKKFDIELIADESRAAYVIKATPLSNLNDGFTPIIINVLDGNERVSTINLVLIKR